MTLPRIPFLGIAVASLLFVSACAYYLDKPIVLYLHSRLPPEAAEIATLIGALADPQPYFVGFALFFIVIRLNRQSLQIADRALFLFLTVGVADVGAFVIQEATGRPRPYVYLDQHISGLRAFIGDPSYLSFPSRHAMVAGAIATALSLLVPEFRPTFALVAIIVAISRVILNMHYPSDAAIGRMLGFGTTIALVVALSHFGLAVLPKRC